MLDFEKKFRASMKSKVLLLDKIMSYIVKRKGCVAKKSNSETMDMAIKFLRTFDTVASVFSTLWLLIGSYFVYSCYDKVIHDEKDKDSDNFCDYTAYLFAFIVITIGFISLALSIIAAVCMCAVRNNE